MLKEKHTLRILYRFFCLFFLLFFCSACQGSGLRSELQEELLSSPMLGEYFYAELEPYKKEVGEVYNHKNKLWWDTFASADLNTLEQTALKENYDISS